MKPKSQSAIEFLMTYGWAILVIAIIIGLLFQLRVFSPSLPASCLSGAPFFCSNPILYSNDTLAVQIGELGSTFNVTKLNCTASAATPTFFTSVSSVRLVSGAISTMRFTCPLTSNAVGSSFSGKLWIYYSTPTQTDLEAQVGTFTATVIGTGVTTGSVSQQYALTMISGSGGYVLPPTGNYSGSVEITALPNTGYVFGNWMGEGSGSYTGTSDPASVTMNGNVTETASYVPQSYSFSATANAGGNVTCSYFLNRTTASCSATYPYGTQISVSATPAPGHIFSSWDCTGGACSPASTSPTSVTIVASNVLVIADFSTQPYSFWVAAGTGGSVSCEYTSNGTAAPCTANYSTGTQITAIATPGTGYSFAYWTCLPVGACSNAESDPTTVTAASDPLAIANFAIHAYSFSATSGTGGSVACSFASDNVVTPCVSSYPYGTQVTVTASPNAGDSFGGWTGTGAGSYTGASNPATAVVDSVVTETAAFAPSAYSFSATNSTPGGSVSCTSGGAFAPCSGSYALGTRMNMTATPYAGYVFSSWTGTGPGSYTGTSDPANATVDGAVTEAAAFAMQLNSLSATAGTGGTVSCAYAANGVGAPCSGTYARGTQISITATPDGGYVFSSWACTAGICSTATTSPTTATMNSAANVLASFAVQSNDFSATAGTGGSVSCAYASNSAATPCSANYDPGTVIAVTATPDTGYYFTSWSCAGGFCVPATSSPTAVTVGASTTSVLANFAAQSYSFFASAGPGGTVSCTMDGMATSCIADYPYGTQYVVTATPNPGYSLTYWDCSSACSPTSVSPTTVTISDFPNNVLANFAINYYAFNATAGAGGSVSCAYASNGTATSCSAHYPYGTQISVSAGPASGYLFTGWTCTAGACSALSSSPTTVTVTARTSVSASFVTQLNSFSATAGTGGSVSCAYASNSVSAPCSGTYAYGTQISVAAAAGTGYAFSGWTCAPGACSTNSTSPTIVTAAPGASAVADFAILSYLFSATAGTGGSVSCTIGGVASPCSSSYPYQTQVAVTATPASGYIFSGWTCTGSSCSPSSSSPTTVTLGAAATSAVANFAIQSYQFSATAGTGGTVSCSPSCSGTYAYGTPITVTATPSTGYLFAAWTCTGSSCSPSSSSPATVILGAAPASASASFAVQPYSFSATAESGGSVSCAYSSNSAATPCSANYTHGTAITVTAAQGTGYAFSGWTCTAGACNTLTSSPMAATVGSGTTSAIADFAPISYSFSANAVPSAYGYVTCSGQGSSCSTAYAYGTQEAATAHPYSGYYLSGWTCTGTGVACAGSGTTQTETMPVGGAALTADFAPLLYPFSANAVPSAAGEVSCSGGGATSCSPGNYLYGNVITVTATPIGSNVLSAWTCAPSGACSVSGNVATVTMPVGGATAYADFQPSVETLTLDNDGCASVSGAGSYGYGTSEQFSANVQTGYSLSWAGSGTGSYSGPSNPASATMDSAVTETAVCTISSYSFLANALPSAGGTVSCSGQGTSCNALYPYGSQETVTATPSANYFISGWTCTGTGVACTGTGTTQAVTMPVGGATMTADFSTNSYPLAIVLGSGGSVTCNGSSCLATYPYNSLIAVAANPRNGYSLSSLSCAPGSACSISGSSATVTMPLNGVTLTAAFSANAYPFTASPGTGGSITCNGLSCLATYPYNSQVSASANPANGYSFSGWTCAPTTACSTNSLSPTLVTVPIGGVTVAAAFSANAYSFSASPGTGGTMTCNGLSCAAAYTYNSQVIATANPANGYSFNSLSCTPSAACSISGANATVTMPASAVTVFASFTANAYSFTATAVPTAGGTVNCAGGGASNCLANDYQYGNVIQVTAASQSGYSFSNWTCSPSSACSTLTTSPTLATVPIGGATVQANFAVQPNSFNAVAGSYGAVVCSGQGSSCNANYPLNTQETVTAIPNPGYTLTGWTCIPNGACSGSGLTQTVTIPANGVIVTANFAAYVCPSGGGLTCTVTTFGTNTILTFNGVGSEFWTPPAGVTAVNVLVVAGGGGGGGNIAGGGGAGGMQYVTGFAVSVGSSYNVVVGAGGAGGGNGGVGSRGSNSIFNSIVSNGGGGGGAFRSAGGTSGGSGGGGVDSYYCQYTCGAGAGTPGQGNAGGGSGGYGTGPGGSGGGGAGAAGTPGSPVWYPGAGGVGLQSSITGTAKYYAGGGGGGSDTSYYNCAAGGLGGGGGGGSAAGVAGTNGLGGGGGGGMAGYGGGAGGSGVVIISYPPP